MDEVVVILTSLPDRAAAMQLAQALMTTAQHRGAPGKNLDFGAGLLQAYEAVLAVESGVAYGGHAFDDAALHECLGSVQQHLEPGGRLLLDVYEADSFHAECAPEDFDGTSSEPIVRIDHDGQELTVFESLGIAVEDLAAAELLVRRARAEGSGTEVEF